MIIHTRNRTPSRKENKKKIRNIIFLLLVFCLFGFFGNFTQTTSSINEWLRLKGFFKTFFLEDPKGYVSAIPTNLFKSLTGSKNLPVIALDINFKNWKKLALKRQNALTEGVLIKDESDFVNGSLRYKNKIFDVKLRLKGDHTDHLMGKKWSFRIKLEDDKKIFGLRRFSIQNPRTRFFQSEPIFYEFLKEFGIITPRYFFVQTYLNGEKIGVMAIEEHFSKEMAENNHRKESVFIGINESRKYTGKNNYNLLYDSNLKTFQHKKIRNSVELSEDLENAIGLMRSFLQNDLGTTQVFDEILMGRFLALIDVFTAGHGMNENSRFYYNPINALLEPVGFDSNIGEDTNFYGSTILGTQITDSAIRLVYANTVKQIALQLDDPKFIKKLRTLDLKFENQLRSEFFLKPPPFSRNLQKFKDRIKKIENLLSVNPLIIGSFNDCAAEKFYGWAIDISKPSRKVEVHVKDMYGSQKAIIANKNIEQFNKIGLHNLGLENANHGFLIPKDIRYLIKRCEERENLSDYYGGYLSSYSEGSEYYSLIDTLFYIKDMQPTLEIINLTQKSVKIHNILNNQRPLELDRFKLPISLKPGEKKLINFNSNHDLEAQSVINVVSSFETQEKLFKNVTSKYASPLKKNPIPNSTSVLQLENHPFLSLNEKDKLLTVSEGKWRVAKNLIVPSGYSLEIKKNTHLSFEQNYGIISHGQILMNGSVVEPIILDSATPGKHWNGLVVIGSHKTNKSSMVNVIVRNTKNFNVNRWRQTGSIVFFNTDVKIDNLSLENTSSEDAINIIKSNFEISNLDVKNTISDGIDVDFSNGSISSSTFKYIGKAGGGDAIDVSGSNVNLNNIIIKKVDDKAVSVGERSKVSASNLKITESNIGIASKDSSKIVISSSIFSNIRLAALMAYIKKLEYGPAKIEATGIIFTDNSPKAKVQENSSIKLNGRAIATQAIYIDDIYNKKVKVFN